jgi:hypothetical protein
MGVAAAGFGATSAFASADNPPTGLSRRTARMPPFTLSPSGNVSAKVPSALVAR